MRRKGISPLIAAVLLIAFTMAVASLFAQWAPQLVQDAQGDTQQQAQDIQSNSDIVLDVSYDTNTQNATVQQTSGSSQAGEVLVTVYGDNVEQGTVTLDDNTRDVAVIAGNTSNVDRVTAEPTDKPGAPTAEATSPFN